MKCDAIRIDHEYIRTVPFFIKIAELVTCIIIWICVGCVPWFGLHGAGGFTNFSASISFVFTLILFILYLLHVIKKLPGPWILIEVLTIGLSAVLMAISLIVCAVYVQYYGNGLIGAVVFNLVGLVLYGVEFFFRFRFMRNEGVNFSTPSQNTESAETPADNKDGAPYVIGA